MNINHSISAPSVPDVADTTSSTENKSVAARFMHMMADGDRDTFDRLVAPEAINLIKIGQPYSLGDKWEEHVLALLSRLDNADKHYEINTVAHGIRDPTSILRCQGIVATDPGFGTTEVGGIVARFVARPRDLKATTPIAARILLDNVYGWFDRIDRGVYGLTSAGEEALKRWPVDA